MDGFFEAYRAEAKVYDEMMDDAGAVRPHWQALVKSLQALPEGELAQYRAQAERKLRDNGVTYNVHGESDADQRKWELDPVPLVLDGAEWAQIEAGLVQRAELLNRVLCDLYGSQQLLTDGHLPYDLVLEHQGFLRPLCGVPVPGERRLFVYAADLARGPDGRMWIINDRTQAPVGSGYVLENRTAMAQIMKGFLGDLGVRRLAGFFRAYGNGLQALSPGGKRDPRIVVFTPGPYSPTYFEHAYLATYLGYNLVEGGDLTVRDNKLWLKTLEGLHPVDILIRRVNDSWCDPLALRGESQLGIPGLVECVRQGTVTVVNSLGSGVLENAGLMSFLPGLSRHLLGEELLLPSAATWWCGQEKERAHVLANLDSMVLKPINRKLHTNAEFGGSLNADEREAWRARILEHPACFIGQQQVSFSTSPAFDGESLEPRHSVLRVLLAWNGERYEVMPGGLTRAASDRTAASVSMSLSGLVKDTWVLGGSQDEHTSAWLQAQEDERPLLVKGILTSREGENVFWVGRYAERAEILIHLLREILRRFDERTEFFGESSNSVSMDRMLQVLGQVSGTVPGFSGDSDKAKALRANPEEELRSLALDPERAGTLASILRSITQSAYHVRNLWSYDAWRVLGNLDHSWSQVCKRRGMNLFTLLNELDQAFIWLKAFAGLTRESMTRGDAWHLQELGRRIERGYMISSSISGMLLKPVAEEQRYDVFESVLRIHESLITYRRRYRTTPRKQSVMQLLLFDRSNPHSLVYQLLRLRMSVSHLPGEQRHAVEVDEIDVLLRRLGEAEIQGEMDDDAWRDLLSGISSALMAFSDQLSHLYFTHARVSRTAFGFRHNPEAP